MTNLEMMLPFPITIEAKETTRDMTVRSRVILNKSYKVSLQFKNTTIIVDIYEGDPRYQTIVDHLKSEGVEL